VLNYVNKRGREKYRKIQKQKSMDKRLLRCKRRTEERRMIKKERPKMMEQIEEKSVRNK
jgi:hypothetical protein